MNLHLDPTWSSSELEANLRKLRKALPRRAQTQWIIGGDTNITPEDEGPFHMSTSRRSAGSGKHRIWNRVFDDLTELEQSNFTRRDAMGRGNDKN